MTAKVPVSESGMATAGIMVARIRRKKSRTTSTTSPMLISKVISTSRTEARMVPARSSAICILMAGEMEVARVGNKAFTRSMVSRMLAPGSRRTTITTARLPSTQPATRLFSTSSNTLAKSRRRTAEPSR